MEHKLLHEPEFDFESFRTNLTTWQAVGAAEVNIDWSTGSGPSVAYFPSGDRKFVVTWRCQVQLTHYSEIYADFIEIKLLPKLVDCVCQKGLRPIVRCVDQQPVVVMRQRRREIEAAERLVAGHP